MKRDGIIIKSLSQGSSDNVDVAAFEGYVDDDDDIDVGAFQSFNIDEDINNVSETSS
jgi:hypothetical protein